MKKQLFVVMLLLLSNVALGQSQQKCPVSLAIQAENKTGRPLPLFDDVIQQEFLEAFKKSLLTNLGATTLFEPNLFNKSGALLGKSTHTCPSDAAIQTGLRRDAKLDFEKFSALLTPHIICSADVVTTGTLCLKFSGKSSTIIKEPESGTKFDHNYAASGDIPLRLEPSTKTIQGNGKMKRDTAVGATSTGLPFSGAGSSPKKETSAQVTGKLFENNVARLKISTTATRNYDVNYQIESVNKTIPYFEGNFEIDLEIPFHAGAEKTESKIWQPAPGYDITSSYNYHFELRNCGGQ